MNNTANATLQPDPELTQKMVVDFLSSPDACPTTGNADDDGLGMTKNADRHISTHCAHVFLFEHDVYKIKRAVRYSYLDLSTLEKRHAMCLRELALNQPVLPDIYVDVVPVTQAQDGSFQINGRGKVVEWAIHMKRFSEKLVLDNLARENRLDNVIAEKLGRSIAEYHAALPSQKVTDGDARIREVVEELIHELDQNESTFSRSDLNRFAQSGLKELSACEPLLNQRAHDGFIRRCHGDLHLRNLILHNNVPVPFDALEFDERMATTDVLYDLAFLLMDLDYRGLNDQANTVFNQYILHSQDQNIKGLRLLPLFLFCRAGIRAMTSAQASTFDKHDPARLRREAGDYLALALKYLDHSSPMLVAVGGLSGTGKSTQARLLAPALGNTPGALLLRSDVERKHSLGYEATSALPVSHYTSNASRLNYALLLSKAEAALEAGVSVVVDAVFLEEDQRRAVERLASDKQVEFAGFWLEAPRDTLEQRVANRRDDASDADVQVLAKQLQKDCGEMRWQRISALGSVQEVNARTLSYLQSKEAMNRDT